MASFDTSFGWCFVALAAAFATALAPAVARHVYPGAPGLAQRLAAPLLFGALAAASFAGAGPGAMLAFAVAGTLLSVAERRKRRRVAVRAS